ncbi:hypothetical protein GALMADRAFT_266050 [Galerina marginata CBS 339.88]|uniref:Uncharacterized protein n=1 Tax=Galerina marginata (strain CBS 339.88) TaxID=685588 RepID=A0A067T8A9_GALM3|nr:hypothetical protein GALMADRAFT_266050 [Galerina marginata CBS 339.88]
MPCLLCGNPSAPSLLNLTHLCRTSVETVSPQWMEMQSLELQISEAQHTLEKLLEQHRELRTLMNRSHDPVVLRVPPEVAGSIFRFCMPENDALAACNREEKGILRAPLTLGAVCRGWRQLAWSIPHLWNTLAIHLKTLKHTTQCEIGEQWLARSGQLPLSIYIKGSKASGENPAQEFQPLIAAINRECGRWKHLDLHASADFISHFGDDSHGPSILQRLQLYSPNGQGICRFHLKNVNHQPRHVQIGSFCFTSIHIRWNAVTTLTLHSLDPREFKGILQVVPQLSYCRLVSVAAPASAIAEAPIMHEQLQVLEISFARAAEDLFFHNFTFPSLQKLTISSTVRGPLADCFISFFERWCFSLTILRVVGARISSEDFFLRILQTSPLLFNLEAGQLTPQPFEALARILANSTSDLPSTIPNTHRYLFPALKFMYLTLTDFPSWNILLDIFGSPANISSSHRRPLSTLNVTVAKFRTPIEAHIDPEIIARILDLRKLGVTMDIRLTLGKYDEDFLQMSQAFHHKKESPSINI